jgi:IS605 OrfB family transposase
MKDQDHKVSHAMVNTARDNKISVIRLEQLENIRQMARTSRKKKQIYITGHSIVYLNSLNTKRI